jgi:allantoinase
MQMLHIFTGDRVLLPGRDEPVAATVEVNLETGKITAIQETKWTRSESTADIGNWTDAGDNVIIPGLVE